MVIYIGADHRGFALKEKLKIVLQNKGYEVKDMGAASLDPDDDYVDFAENVGKAISLDPESRGILICGSGAGMNIVANKFPNVRATAGFVMDDVFDARRHDDINVLTFAANFVSEEEAGKMADVFLKATFESVERRIRRLEKIHRIEVQK